MRILTVYPKRIVPDGDACDRCPRELGHGGRYARITENGLTRLLRLCYRYLGDERRAADRVLREA